MISRLKCPQFKHKMSARAACSACSFFQLCTDALLTKLIHCLQELIGDDNTGHGPLENEIGYQIDTDELPDPLDLVDDKDNIHKWVEIVRNKLQTIPAPLSLAQPMPEQSTVWESPPPPPYPY